jgi:phage tail sheath gpL-like
MSTQVVTYALDDSTSVSFEIEPTDGFRPASAGEVIARVRDAVGPAVEAAKAVLDKVKEARPDEVEVTFGVKVSGGAQWLIAKSAGEASFEITLTWTRERSEAGSGTSAAVPSPGQGQGGG